MKYWFSIFCIIFIASFFCGKLNVLHSQTVNPSIQAQIDSLNIWIKTQLETTGKIDQHKLDSINERIRESQNKLLTNKQSSPQSNINNSSSAEKTIVRDMMPGSVFTVPAGVTWKIKKISCKTEMGGYSILVTSVKFKEIYESGEQISMPAFTSEASLLTEDTSSVTYTFEIIETSKPK